MSTGVNTVETVPRRPASCLPWNVARSAWRDCHRSPQHCHTCITGRLHV